MKIMIGMLGGIAIGAGVVLYCVEGLTVDVLNELIKYLVEEK